MGGLLFKCIREEEHSMKLRPSEVADLDDELQLLRRRRRRRRPRQRKIKGGRQGAPPKFVLYDIEGLRAVDDHEGVRRLLLKMPEWVAQPPTDGCIEYWYYFLRDEQPLTPAKLLYPAARARLPWPLLYTASPATLQNFANSVNRIAHCQLISLLSIGDPAPSQTEEKQGRQEKQHFSIKVLGRTKRMIKLNRSRKVSKLWRPMSLVKRAYYKLRNRDHGPTEC